MNQSSINGASINGSTARYVLGTALVSISLTAIGTLSKLAKGISIANIAIGLSGSGNKAKTATGLSNISIGLVGQGIKATFGGGVTSIILDGSAQGQSSISGMGQADILMFAKQDIPSPDIQPTTTTPAHQYRQITQQADVRIISIQKDTSISIDADIRSARYDQERRST